MSRNAPRTFIAVPLEASCRSKLQALQEVFGFAHDAVKWVEPGNLHLTLLFLGEVPLRQSVDVCRAVRRAASVTPPFRMGVSGVGCFPNARRPRVLWAGVEEGRDDVITLHHALEEPLFELGCYRREERDYTPHITLGRIKSDDVTPEFHAALTEQADWTGGRQMVREVQVLTSELRSAGPEYTVLSREPLRGDPDEIE